MLLAAVPSTRGILNGSAKRRAIFIKSIPFLSRNAILSSPSERINLNCLFDVIIDTIDRDCVSMSARKETRSGRSRVNPIPD